MKNTKERLLQTAAKLFAKHGMDCVSTRDLAKVSGVNLCSINYYFGSKQNLYEAVLDDAIEQIISFMKTRQLPLKSKFLSEYEEFDVFIENMVDFLCSDRISGPQAELFIKEIINPTNAYNRLYEQVIEPLHKRMTELVMILTGLSEVEAILEIHCLLGQIVMFKVHRAAILRRLNMKKYTPEFVNVIKSHIIRNCHVILKEDKQ